MNSTLTNFHNRKFAGFADPDGDEEVDIVTLRKAKYMRFTERMIGYPAKIGRRGTNMPTSKDSTIIHSVRKGLLPWYHPQKTPGEYVEYWEEKNKQAKESDSGFRKVKSRPWGDYFYTCFFGLAGKLILMDKDTLMEKRAYLYQDMDVSNLPQDGSKGQARACRANQQKCVDWFVGEWDGNYTDWKEDEIATTTQS